MPKLDDFTFWLCLSLRQTPSPNFGLRPKISQEVKFFYFVWLWTQAQRSFSANFDRSDRLLAISWDQSSDD